MNFFHWGEHFVTGLTEVDKQQHHLLVKSIGVGSKTGTSNF